MFGWSIYNGATYYIDVFGKRFQNELEALKRDVAKWQNSPTEGLVESPPLAGADSNGNGGNGAKKEPVDEIPLLDSKAQVPSISTAVESIEREGVRERNQS